MGIHEGHRARKKEKYRQFGLDSFTDYEALELLLFYAIPRADVNPLAKRLLERFGTLEAVLCARQEELEVVEGVGSHISTLLSMILPLHRRAIVSSSRHAVPLATTEQLGIYFCHLFFGMQGEQFYQVCLDAKGKLLRCLKISEGGPDAVNLNIRGIVENALRCNASAVALAHNHPSGVALPSPEDNDVTVRIRNALDTVGIRLTDHIIVADNDFVSLRQNGLFAQEKE